MKKENNKVTTDLLNKHSNTKVVIKLNNGRVISGHLTKNETNHTLKLGVKHLVINPEELQTINAQN